jgi:hypothetical protein
LVGTDSDFGTAGLPLPNGERVGVRGFRPIESHEPLTPPLSLREREPAAVVALSCPNLMNFPLNVFQSIAFNAA